MEQGVWQEIERLYQKFQQLGISEAVDYESKYSANPVFPPLKVLLSFA